MPNTQDNMNLRQFVSVANPDLSMVQGDRISCDLTRVGYLLHDEAIFKIQPQHKMTIPLQDGPDTDAMVERTIREAIPLSVPKDLPIHGTPDAILAELERQLGQPVAVLYVMPHRSAEAVAKAISDASGIPVIANVYNYEPDKIYGLAKVIGWNPRIGDRQGLIIFSQNIACVRIPYWPS